MKKIIYFLFFFFSFLFAFLEVNAASSLVECDYYIPFNNDTYILSLIIDSDHKVYYNWGQEVSVNGQFYVYYDAGEEQFFTDFYNLIYSDGDAVAACPILYRRIETYKKINDDDKWMHFDWHQNFKYLGDKVFSVGSIIGDQILNPNFSPSSTTYHSYTVTKFNPSSFEFEASQGSVNVPTSYCSQEGFKKPIKFIGRIFRILKIIIPLILIIFGVIDLMKAVTGSKDDEIKKSIRSLTMRGIAGVCIFFVPTIINLAFSLVDDWNQYSTDYSNCTKCLVKPDDC